MKKLISLTIASFAIAALTPTVTQAQTSAPSNPTTIPNETNEPSSTPVTPGESAAPTTTSPSVKTPGTCPALSSSTGTSSMGTTDATSSTTYSTSSSTSTTSGSTSSNTASTADATPSSMTMSSATSPASTVSTNSNVSRLLDASADQIEYNNLIGPTHYIKLAVGNSPLCSLSVTPLQDIYATSSIQVLDASGKSVAAVVTKQDNGSAKISFEQPVSAGSDLTVALQGVEYASSLTPTTVQYSIAGRFADYDQEIPYGIAQVQRFLR